MPEITKEDLEKALEVIRSKDGLESIDKLSTSVSKVIEFYQKATTKIDKFTIDYAAEQGKKKQLLCDYFWHALLDAETLTKNFILLQAIDRYYSGENTPEETAIFKKCFDDVVKIDDFVTNYTEKLKESHQSTRVSFYRELVEVDHLKFNGALLEAIDRYYSGESSPEETVIFKKCFDTALSYTEKQHVQIRHPNSTRRLNDRFTNKTLPDLFEALTRSNSDKTEHTIPEYKPIDFGKKASGDKPTSVSATLATTDGTKLTDKNFVGYSREVHDAFMTLFENGNKKFSLKALYRELTNRGDTREFSTAQLKPLFEALEKMRTLDVGFECEENPKYSGYGHLLSFRWNIPISENGSEIKYQDLVITVTDTMPSVLYGNAQKYGQIITTEKDMLIIKNYKDGKLSDRRADDTPDRIAVKGYLIKRIQNMRTGNGDNDTIRFDTIIKTALGKEITDKKARLRMNNYIITVLENWKGKYFESYVEKGTGKNKSYKIALKEVETE